MVVAKKPTVSFDARESTAWSCASSDALCASTAAIRSSSGAVAISTASMIFFSRELRDGGEADMLDDFSGCGDVANVFAVAIGLKLRAAC